MKKNKSGLSLLSRAIIALRWLWSKIDPLKLLKKISDREKSLSSYRGSTPCEEARMSYILGIARAISVLLLLSLLRTTIAIGASVISFDKIYYMVKDIAYIRSYGEGEPDELSYSKPMQNQVFDDFKDGLIVASDSEIKMFTSTGRVTLTQGSEQVNPRISTSNGYVLIYDQGRSSFSIYNSFVRLYSESTEYPISYAVMSENGCFLIVSGSDKYRSVVGIYNSSFERISEYSKNSHVISASLSDNGRYAAILSLNALKGEGITTLSLIDCKKNKVMYETQFNGSMPYSCELLSGEKVAVFLDDKVCTVDRNGNVTSETPLEMRAERLAVEGELAAIILTDDLGKRTVEVYDGGVKTFAKQIDGNVKDIKIGGGYIYLLYSREIVRISTQLGTVSRARVSADSIRIVTFDGGRVAVCSQNAAVYIKFE